MFGRAVGGERLPVQSGAFAYGEQRYKAFRVRGDNRQRIVSDLRETDYY